ncbi:hypothetical protein EBT31_23370 [bacterium]|jgi:hypothetical protein|nr:hypothetical protein [bacterium]
MSKEQTMKQRNLLSARDIYMPRLRQLRDEIRKDVQDNQRKAQALRRAEQAEAWDEIKATTWKLRRK